ncbi:MAG: hypothetical protein WEB88_15690 [Gemmatimonadota bacterium]
MIAFSSSALILLLVIGYGATAGLLVEALEENGCPVPSARQPLTQLPI